MNTGIARAKGKQGRLDHIDGLRALAALYVLFHHILLYVNSGLPHFHFISLPGLFIFGHFAVDVFIVLSGFCLMLPVLRNHGVLRGGAWEFFRKRARRILPPYYAALAISLVCIVFWISRGDRVGMWDVALPVTPAAIWAHLFLVQDAFNATHHRINYPLWTISVEWRIYFLFPALVYCWHRFGPLLTTAVTVLVSYLLLFPLQYTVFDSSPTGVCLHFYGLFSLGMLAAGLSTSGDGALAALRARAPWRTLTLLLPPIAMVSTKNYAHVGHLPWQIEDLLVGTAAASLLVALSPGGNSDPWRRVREVLASRPLVFVGTISFSLYLLHAPLLEVIWVYAVNPLNLSAIRAFLLLVTGGTVVITAASYLFFLAFERPFIMRRNGGGVRAHPAPVRDPDPALSRD